MVGYETEGVLVDDVYTDGVVERSYEGNILNETITFISADKLNDDVDLSQRISIMADPYAFENVRRMRYVTWAGVDWSVASVEIKRPRLILSLGGPYDGEKPTP